MIVAANMTWLIAMIAAIAYAIHGNTDQAQWMMFAAVFARLWNISESKRDK